MKYHVFNNKEKVATVTLQPTNDLSLIEYLLNKAMNSHLSVRHSSLQFKDLVMSVNGLKAEGSEERFKYQLIPAAGFRIGTGKNCSSIFGIGSPAYLKSIGTRRAHADRIGHIFPNEKAVLRYCSGHKAALEKLVRDGWTFSVESLTDEAPQNEELMSLIEQINAAEPEEVVHAYGETMDEEAILRMKELHLMPEIVKQFEKDGTVMKSEFGGILYDLDDAGKKAIQIVKEEYHGLPYHVILSHTEVGELYAVLFVSQKKEEWESERMDRYGDVFAYVYNATDPIFSELGCVRIEPQNGGLVRVE